MINRIALLPKWFVFFLLIGSMAAGSFLPIPFGGLLFFVIYAGWVFALADSSNRLLPSDRQRSIQKLKLALLYAVCYAIVGGTFIHNHKGVKGILVPFHLFAMFCIFYSMYFAAKSIRSLELRRDATFSDSLGVFFGLWFFPIGVWFVQPKINRIIGSENDLKTA